MQKCIATIPRLLFSLQMAIGETMVTTIVMTTTIGMTMTGVDIMTMMMTTMIIGIGGDE
jgi:hypothetical protein